MDASGLLPTYRLDGAEFTGLGSGYGSESALSTLRSAQASKRLLLLRALHDHAAARPEWQAAGLDESWALLRAATERHPAAAHVLTHPFVDSWATRSLRRLPPWGGDDPVDLGYLSGLAVAAAVRAGLDVTLTVPARGGDLFLPTLGLAYGLGPGPVAVRHEGGTLRIGDGTTVSAPYTEDAPGWCAHRHHAAGSLAVTIEDLDPYRACFGHPVAPRLSPAAAGGLRALLDRAWHLLAADHPEHAMAVAGCVRSIVPLVTPGTGSTSGSAQRAFGAVAVSIPDTPAELALLLIHETQHVKLGALLDLVDLAPATDGGGYHAPWRSDPRGARALLQGIYAHAGVADFWRVLRRRASGVRAREADFEFAYWLAQTRLAARELSGSGGLTPSGKRFVADLSRTLDGWAAEPVDDAVARGVADLTAAVAVRWRLDNHRPDPALVARIADDWRAGRPCPAVGRPAVATVDQAGGPARVEGLAAQVRARLTGAAAPDVEPADRAYLDGRADEALAGYAARAERVPDDPNAWVGLALAATAGGDAEAGRALTARPDLVRAVFLRLAGGERRPGPHAVARWLDGGLP